MTDEAGAPLADVRVRVAIPATDMRFVDVSTPHKRLETRTDGRGEYRLEIPGIAERTTVSLDAMKPGFRRLVGTVFAGGDRKSVEVGPGAEAEASLILKPALYSAGVVVDEQGSPIPSVKTTARRVSAGGYVFIEVTATNPDGSFEIFSYPVRPPGQNLQSKGAVSFVHPDYIEAEIEDIYALAPEKREAMRIVLGTGYKLSIYDLFDERGAFIVDPGKDSDRLKIGQLAEGDTFWMVGRTRIGSVSEFVSHILAETAGQNADEYSVRVVYNFSRVEFDGSRTASLKLTKDDRKQLQVLSEQLAPRSRDTRWRNASSMTQS